jgi:hypothetical protein
MSQILSRRTSIVNPSASLRWHDGVSISTIQFQTSAASSGSDVI